MSLSINIFGIISVYLITFLCNFSITSAGETQADILRGVTLKNWPYANLLSGKYEGFVIDVMNEIADIIGFEYRLYFAPDGKYGGTVVNGKVNGMIGEVYNNRADFAIADLTVTDIRKKLVDFTEPFIETGISILIHKDNAKNIRSFRDLTDQTDIKYGTYRNSATAKLFAQSDDPVIRKMNEQMVKNKDVFVSTAKEGVDKVNSTKYAFLVESTFAEFLSGMYCELTYIEDKNNYFPRQYAIAVPKDSIYTPKFNSAIKKLKANGSLTRLYKIYWRDRCTKNDSNSKITKDKSPTIKWADRGYDLSKGYEVSISNSILTLILLILSSVLL